MNTEMTVGAGRSTERPALARDRADFRSLAVGAGCAALVLLLAAGTVLFTTRTRLTSNVFTVGLTTLAAGLLGALLVALRPRNPVGWSFLATGLGFMVGLFAEQYAAYGLLVRPGSLPGAEVALWLSYWIFPPALIPMFVLVPLYFPDGWLPSPRWRWVARAALWLLPLTAVSRAVTPGPTYLFGSDLVNPYGIEALAGVTWLTDTLPGLAWLALTIAATVSLVVRFRRADQTVRQQIKWLVYAVAVTAIAFAVDATVALAAPASYSAVFKVVQLVPMLVVVAVAVAVLRHRLFDIDRLVNRTLLYGLLTACVVAIYVTVVAGLSALVDAPQRGIGVSLVATGLVAVAFAPLRSRLQRLVDRLLYGQRADPYRTLALLGRRLETTLQLGMVLPQVARTVAEAFQVPYVAVEVLDHGGYRTQAEHGQPPGTESTPLHLPLSYGNEPVGRLVLAGPGRRVELAPADRRLLGDLAGQIGVAVHSVQAGEEAARLSDDLQRSRERLVLAREEERRRIGRDLHDGLGPQLAGLTMTLEAARDLVRADPRHAEELLAELQGRAELAVQDVRRIAHQLRPPALDALGLVGALRSHAASHQRVQITVDAPQPLPTLPAAVELAAYRIVLEALHNVISHAEASSCRVMLQAERDPEALRVQVIDDGRGMPTDAPVGVGLQSMRERAVELGGSCVVRSADGGGTMVEAVLPLSGRGRSATRGADQHPDL
jgi:signal transduction histidine kinase